MSNLRQHDWEINLQPGVYLIIPYFGKSGRIRKGKCKRGWFYRIRSGVYETRRPTIEEARAKIQEATYILNVACEYY